MNRRKHLKSLARATKKAASVTAAPEVSAAETFEYSGNYQGASFTKARGYPLWGTLDTRYDLQSFDQRELVRRSRALFANSGIARVPITIAMMVGSQTPQMASASKSWNKVAEQLLRFENGSAMICDVAGTHNLEDAQRLIEFLAMRDGDCFVVLTKTSTGRASWRIYEGHVVNGQPNDAGNNQYWNQGILRNANGRPVSYYFEDQNPIGAVGGTVIPASDVIHYQYNDGMAPRGIPALAHAIVNIIDIIERRGFTKATIKLRAMLGLQITADAEAKPQGDRPFLSPMLNATGPRAGLPANSMDQGPKVENVEMAGNTASIMRLPPGYKADVLNDDSPSPNATEFENELLRDVAIGLQMPPQVIFWLEKQTGPMVRFTVRMAEKRIAQRRQYMRNTFLNRWIGYQLSLAIKAGNLTVPASGLPDKWYACTYKEPASLTIDVGRDGVLELKQLDAGVASLHDVVGTAGGDWEETLDQKFEENDRVMELAMKLMKKYPELPLAQAMAMFRMTGRKADDLAGAEVPEPEPVDDEKTDPAQDEGTNDKPE